MEKYSLKTQCPKCNCEHLTSNWIDKLFPVGEVIERKCTNCGFILYQLPLDSKQVPQFGVKLSTG